jgi:DNA-binding transcriptional MerR regulator
MSTVILTLFGEAYAPPETKPVKKNREREKKNPSTLIDSKGIIPRKRKLVKTNVESASDILNGWQPEKQYYSIGEVAGLYKVNTSHIRFWTKEFNFKVRTTRKGDRLYTPEQIYELRTIYHLVKERGFTLAGAKTKLKEEKKNVNASLSLKQSLSKLKQQLITIRQQLD